MAKLYGHPSKVKLRRNKVEHPGKGCFIFINEFTALIHLLVVLQEDGLYFYPFATRDQAYENAMFAKEAGLDWQILSFCLSARSGPIYRYLKYVFKSRATSKSIQGYRFKRFYRILKRYAE